MVRGVNFKERTSCKQLMIAINVQGEGVIIFFTKLCPEGLKSFSDQLCLELMPIFMKTCPFYIKTFPPLNKCKIQKSACNKFVRIMIASAARIYNLHYLCF